jgi:hypothetical protein
MCAGSAAARVSTPRILSCRVFGIRSHAFDGILGWHALWRGLSRFSDSRAFCCCCCCLPLLWAHLLMLMLILQLAMQTVASHLERFIFPRHILYSLWIALDARVGVTRNRLCSARFPPPPN